MSFTQGKIYHLLHSSIPLVYLVQSDNFYNFSPQNQTYELKLNKRYHVVDDNENTIALVYKTKEYDGSYTFENKTTPNPFTYDDFFTKPTIERQKGNSGSLPQGITRGITRGKKGGSRRRRCRRKTSRFLKNKYIYKNELRRK